MKTKFTMILTLFMALIVQISFAQQKTVSGTVSDENGLPLIGTTVLVVGTSSGTTTDFDGKYSIKAKAGDVLSYSYVGYTTQNKTVGAASTINLSLQSDNTLDEVVVTALGIKRDKKSLGYATQKVDGSEISTTKSDNVLNQLSGKAAGVSIQRTNNIGGSTNVIIRGHTSLTGSNQALFVIDGVPVSNRNTNAGTQSQGSNGYDYGNPMSDINTDDIESINILKGAAASVLYGSRASNGVIMITTKKGTESGKRDFSVSINSNITTGFVDKSTFPEFQNEYGAGYGGDDYNFPGYSNVNDDASYGPKFDPNIKLLQWYALYPQLEETYGIATPWVGTENGPITFFESPVSTTNSISVSKNDETGSFRLSYSNYDAIGLLPNSTQDKNTFSIAATKNLNDRFEASGYATYINTKTKGRNSTGYSDNLVGAMRQWGQTNLDYQKQSDAYFATGENITWNPKSPTNLRPIYWDNPYWTRYENFQNDERNRFTGYAELKYKINDHLNVSAKASVDNYSEIQEERRAVGSVAQAFGINEGRDGSFNRSDQESGYLRRNIESTETNIDFLVNYSKNISDAVSFSAFAGINVRKNYLNMITAATNGGLKIPGIYSLQNSRDALPLPKERDEQIEVQGLFANATLGYKDYLFLEASMRRDKSSTLPADNNAYFYPSISGSYIFSKHLNTNLIPYAKFRANYAEVGKDTSFDQINDTYIALQSFQGNASTSVNGRKKNPNLKPELSKSYEIGLEMKFLERANLGFDIAYYKTNTVNQIVPVTVSQTTGYSSKVINTGELENKGIEISAFTSFNLTKNLKWKINANWSKNENKVISLVEGLDEILLGSFGIQSVAKVGQPYGALKGTDYVYHENGQKIVKDNGRYLESDADKIIGNANPDWLAGVRNTFEYKNLAFSFFIDIKSGGEMYSLDQRYGQATGVYATSVYTNDLGNPVRNSIDDGGGWIYPGVLADGSINTNRVDGSAFGNGGYRAFPRSEFVYDASFVKLREASLTYKLTGNQFKSVGLSNASISLVGSNLWIIHKNLPYADPETGFGSGNIQGFSSGSLPTTRNFSINVKLQF